MKPVETEIRVDQESPAQYQISDLEKARSSRRIHSSRIAQSLVTMAPPDVDLTPKQRVMVEQFRLLRTRIKALSNDFQLRTILVTSALPAEGKTTVAANMAVSLSRVEGLRVLLVDFDLRQPNLHEIFGMKQEPGSSAPLAGDAPWQTAVYQVNQRLDVLFGFQPLTDPDRLLQSSRLKTLLSEFKQAYDVVIIDSAPLLAIADTQSLVPLVDCSLFVLGANSTPIAAAKQALSMLENKVAGCIVNSVENLKSEGYYHKSGYGYGYGSPRTEN